MKRVLITGGTGFFGKSILDYFGRNPADYEFTLLSRHTPGSAFAAGFKQSNLPSFKHFPGDVRTFSLDNSHFDWIIHAATPARVDVPDDEMRSIILDGTTNAIRQAQRCSAEKFMMVSSGGVYGGGYTCPIREDDEPHPFTAYGKAKLEAEALAVASGLFTLLPRCFAFVGRHLPQDKHFAIGNFIADARAGRDIVINGDGSPLRSYLYADDLVEWLWAILDRGESGRPYNIGSAAAISIRDLAETVRDALGSSSLVKVLGQSVPGAANVYVPDTTRICRELGVTLKTPLRTAIVQSV